MKTSLSLPLSLSLYIYIYIYIYINPKKYAIKTHTHAHTYTNICTGINQKYKWHMLKQLVIYWVFGQENQYLKSFEIFWNEANVNWYSITDYFRKRRVNSITK